MRSRWFTALLVFFCAVALIPSANAVPVPITGTARWAGSDRYATSGAVAGATLAPPVDTIFLASGANFPDALAAGPAAAAEGTGLLLTDPGTLRSPTREQLERLKPATIVVVGGASVLSDEVAKAAAEAAGAAAIERIAGANRYETAALLADRYAGGGPTPVYVATGQDYPDALAAGMVVIKQQGVLLLTGRNSVPDATAASLSGHAVASLVVVGGPSAVSPSVVAALGDLAKVTPKVVAGEDRYRTAAELVKRNWTTAPKVVLTPGTNFPDALSATAPAGLNQAPVLLTKATCHPDATLDLLSTLKATTVVAVGGSEVTYSGSKSCSPPPPPPPTGPVVYLTFDDGPNFGETSRVLELLKKYGAKATFFQVGSMAKGYPDLVAEVRSGGHAIANHSYTHSMMTRQTNSEILWEIETTDKYIGKTKCVRPPYGDTNARVLSVIEGSGRSQVLWTVDPNDWQRPGSSVIASRVLSRVHNGSVVLMHDGGGDRYQTVDALKTILPTLKARGYTMAALPQC